MRGALRRDKVPPKTTRPRRNTRTGPKKTSTLLSTFKNTAAAFWHRQDVDRNGRVELSREVVCHLLLARELVAHDQHLCHMSANKQLGSHGVLSHIRECRPKKGPSGHEASEKNRMIQSHSEGPEFSSLSKRIGLQHSEHVPLAPKTGVVKNRAPRWGGRRTCRRGAADRKQQASLWPCGTSSCPRQCCSEAVGSPAWPPLHRSRHHLNSYSAIDGLVW